MAQLSTIEDPGDPRIDDFRDLTTADRRPDRPGGRGLVIAEGTVVVRRLLASGYPLRAVLGVPRRIEELRAELAAVSAPVYAADAETMAAAVGFHLNRGVLAVADRVAPPSPAALAGAARLLLVCEGVGDHENLGALFRNAAALGASGVLLGPGCSDPLYRRSVRVSMGHVLRVPFTHAGADWPELLRAAGLRLAALTPAADAVPLGTAGLTGRRVALVLGSEGHGLSAATLAACDVRVRIPLAGDVDSLNVATAAAVAMYAVTG